MHQRATRSSCVISCFVFLELDVLVEHGFAVFALGDDVEADTADVLLRAELLRAVNLLALDLQLQTSPLPQLDDVSSTEMTADNLRESHHDGVDEWLVVRMLFADFLQDLRVADGALMAGHRLVLAERCQRRFVLFDNLVLHILGFNACSVRVSCL